MSDRMALFFSRIRQTSGGCIEWTGWTTGKGYGRLWVDGREVRAHRFAYEAFVAAIPDGLVIDHLCRNRLCVNPRHLEPVTGLENTRRGPGSVTHCKRGHEFTPENTHAKNGHRSCRACDRLRWHERKSVARGNP